jgi:[glutamine synthetase] adenylyltransferase / [glutamine synthetase]-adenylyl-L-tyrosine phosphorylase
MTDRTQSIRGQLARLGFSDRERAERFINDPVMGDVVDEAVLMALGESADPDQALLLLVRFLEAADDQLRHRITQTLKADEDVRGRLFDLLGMSEALGEFLIRHPHQWQVIADSQRLSLPPLAHEMVHDILRAIGADPEQAEPIARGAGDDVLDDLRIAYRSALLQIAARDLAGLAPMEVVAGWLTDLADAVLGGALAIARAGLPPDAEACAFTIIGMGKCGAHELNYVSDVDVIFVAEALPGGDEEAALRTAHALATGVMRACNQATAEGSIWEVDAALRPEGKQGALVRTLASHVGYYERWASTWEFQALLKARPAAGDVALGQAYVDAISPFVWSATDRDGFVDDVQAMRRRVEAHVPTTAGDRELKLGPGGLRDVEFSVQLLQLVHGRSDVMLRSSNTMLALESLATWGYVGRDDAASLAEAYRFLRTLEHRLQLYRLRRTHTLPEDHHDLRRLARAVGYRTDPVEQLTKEWRRHAREVRRIHEKLFYRPLLQAVARLDAGEARLTPEAAEQRLRALGYVDPAGALRHLQALTSGVSRRAAIQRTLLPVLLGWFADGPDPDAGLLAFRRVSDELGSTHWYLRLLRDESVAAERMAHILSSSRYATELLLRAPDGVQMLADDAELIPRTLPTLLNEAQSTASRHDDPTVAVASLRASRRRELFRICVAELTQNAPIDQAGVAISDVATATIAGALAVAQHFVADEHPLVTQIRFSVIGMGRFGGRELGLASDADVMFVYDAPDGVDETAAGKAAFALANELRSLLMAPSADPPLEIDADLRPEGRQGPLVRSLASYAAYYERWSSPWEAQALLRAAPIAGDTDLGAAFIDLIDPLRYPADGLTSEHLREIRRLKARMEAERLPRGADPALHVKLGRGGLSDVEWVVQVIQMQHAHRIPALRTTQTLTALDAAVTEGFLDNADAEILRDAWRMATSVRNANTLVRDRPSDLVPTDIRELRAIGYALGYSLDQPGQVLEDYQRLTRRARKVVERIFYGEE